MLDTGNNTFDEQADRLMLATGSSSLDELAGFLGVSITEVKEAEIRKKLPVEWLLLLLRARSVSPDWVLTGCGPRILCDSSTAYTELYPGGYEERERKARLECLKSVSSRELAEELLRRIACSGL